MRDYRRHGRVLAGSRTKEFMHFLHVTSGTPDSET